MQSAFLPAFYGPNFAAITKYWSGQNFVRFLSCVFLNFSRFEYLVYYSKCSVKRLRWSRGSVLSFSTQVRGFKPDRSRRIFKGQKILSTPSFGGEVNPSVPCRRFAACKRALNVPWKAKLSSMILAHAVPPFAARGLLGNTDEETDWWRKWKRLKH
jgi:hypothetical protein